MKCRIMWHFICICTVCQSTRFLVSGLQGLICCGVDSLFIFGLSTGTKDDSILLDFSLTVKAATLIFISGCGLAFLSAKEGNSGFIYNLVKSK